MTTFDESPIEQFLVHRPGIRRNRRKYVVDTFPLDALLKDAEKNQSD